MAYIEQEMVDERTRARLENILEGSYKSYWKKKRLFDIFFATLILLFFIPLMIVIAIVIYIDDPSASPIYKQVRVGRHEKTFNMYKFRTMRVDADKLENSLTPEELEKYKKEYKLENDPRVTGIGSILRRTSADELPQILNVIKNDMSLIGPRPVLNEETLLYGKDRNTLLSVKPGLTGYWQAYARNNATYQSGERQKMEMYYVRNASLWLDIKILFKTVVSVLRKDGAK